MNPATSNSTTVDNAQINGNGETVAEEPPKNEHTDVKNSGDSEPLLTPTNRDFEAVTEITEKKAESEDRICPASNIDSGKTENEICGDTKSKTKKENTTESQNNDQHIVADVTKSASNSCLPENLSIDLVEEKKLPKSRAPSVKVDTLKRKKKLKKVNDKPTFVEIPFCSHSQHLTGQDQATFIECMEPKKATRKAKPQLHTVLSPADRLGAEQILHELIEIRDGKNLKEKDPVLDTMISVIQLSSTNLSLPAPSTGGGGVQFKELFDFEVNFSESRFHVSLMGAFSAPQPHRGGGLLGCFPARARAWFRASKHPKSWLCAPKLPKPEIEPVPLYTKLVFEAPREAFAKLSGDGKHTVQELFPWTTGSGDTRQDAAVGCNKEDVFKKLRAGIQPR